jgi:tetratricopeptide (TPR) repeat protein
MAKDTPTLIDAEEAFDAGDLEAALIICEGFIGETPDSAPVEVLYLAARCLLELQEPEEAEHLLEIAIKAAGPEPALLHARGVATFEQGRLDEAAKLFQAAVEADQDLGEAHYYLGILAERAGDFGKADQLFADAVKRDPENLEIPTVWSEEAIALVFDEIVEEIPDPLSAWMAGLQVTVEDLPDDEVLIAGDGPISPLILCFFEGEGPGAPQGDEPEAWLTVHPTRVRIFSRNLGKSAHDEYELHHELLEAILWEVMVFLELEESHLAALGLPPDEETEALH